MDRESGMDDWAKVYSTLTDRQLLALIREPHTLRHEAQVALQGEIHKRGLEAGVEPSPSPEEHLSARRDDARRTPLGFLGRLNVIVLALLLILAYLAFWASLSDTLPGDKWPYHVDRGVAKQGMKDALILIGAVLVPGTFLMARTAGHFHFRILAATYNGLAALTVAWAWIIVATNLAETHPIAFAFGDLILYALFALLATVNALSLGGTS